MGEDKKTKSHHTETPFDEEGVFDDKCEICCRRCCCAPPPFRVALFPTILILAVTIVIWALFFYDVTGLCRTDPANPGPCKPTNYTDPVLNVTRLTQCPVDDHPCSYLQVTNVPVAIWALFLFVIVLGWAVIRAIVSILWWIFRALSGKHGMMWEYIKPLDWAVHLIVWNALFFICYNRWLFSATPLVYTVCAAISVIIVIIAIIYIVASLLSTVIVRHLNAQARERAVKFRAKAKLVDKALNKKEDSLVDTFSLGLSKMAKKGAKNARKTAERAKDGDDVVVEMEKNELKSIPEEDLKKSFAAIDKAKKGKINRAQLSEATGVKGIWAKDLWKVFSPDPDGEIYEPEFIAGIREVERGLHDTLLELENRRFIGNIIRLVLMGIFATLGVTIALQAINLQIAVLVSAISLLLVAITMALTGLFGRVLNAFVFLLVSHPYYRGDLVLLGGELIYVRKVTLLNTYGYTPDNKWVMYDNAGVAGSRILNYSRSQDCIFVWEASVHADTPKKTLETWEKTLRAYVTSKPEHWRDISFNITSVTADNKYNIEIKAFLRGANWAHAEVYNPYRAGLWKVLHQSAVQLGVFGAPKDAETDLVKIVSADDVTKPLEKEDESVAATESEGSQKKKEKLKKKESKKEQ